MGPGPPPLGGRVVGAFALSIMFPAAIIRIWPRSRPAMATRFTSEDACRLLAERY